MSRYAIGVGCRRGCPEAAIVSLIRDTWSALAEGGSERPVSIASGSIASGREGTSGARSVLGLFSLARKQGEVGLAAAAATLGLPLHLLDDTLLAAEADRVLTRSSAVARAVGVPSVAEAAALAGAGPGARLLQPRRVREGATCAVAVRDEDRP